MWDYFFFFYLQSFWRTRISTLDCLLLQGDTLWVFHCVSKVEHFAAQHAVSNSSISIQNEDVFNLVGPNLLLEEDTVWGDTLLPLWSLVSLPLTLIGPETKHVEKPSFFSLIFILHRRLLPRRRPTWDIWCVADPSCICFYSNISRLALRNGPVRSFIPQKSSGALMLVKHALRPGVRRLNAHWGLQQWDENASSRWKD